MPRSAANKARPVPVSVVTVCRNAADELEGTIRSVLEQDYPALEFIIIDGASTDHTLEVITPFRERIARVLSEPDHGIYDAMNKGARLATGHYINFMNAGDRFCAPDTVSRVMAPDHEGYDFIYGEHIWDTGERRIPVPCRPLELMWQRICFSHQSLFTRRELQLERPFDTSWRIVSDYAFYFPCYMEGRRFLHRPFPVAVFRAGGLSDRSFYRRTWERWQVVRRLRPGLSTHRYYAALVLEHLARELKKRLRGRQG